jgi:hypothetical protein
VKPGNEGANDGWRNISIALTDLNFGEQKAQSCAIA